MLYVIRYKLYVIRYTLYIIYIIYIIKHTMCNMLYNNLGSHLFPGPVRNLPPVDLGSNLVFVQILLSATPIQQRCHFLLKAFRLLNELYSCFL